MRWVLCFTALMCLLRPVAAQERTQPLQELFFTEVIYPQEKGETQLTFGALIDRSEQVPAAIVPFSIEYGITNRWQIEAAWDGYSRSRSAPVKQLRTARFSVGTKYSLMNIAGSPVHAAVGIDVEFPHPNAFADDEGEDSVDLEPFIAMAVDVGRRLTVFGSATLSWEPHDVAALVEHATPPEDPGTLSAGALVAMARVTVAVEYTNRSDELPWRLDGAPLLTPSIVLHPPHKWEVGVGTPIGLRHGERQPGVVAHIVKEF